MDKAEKKYYFNDQEVTKEVFLTTFADGKYQDVDGTIFYRKNYVLHKEDGPAMTYPYGQTEWWKFGMLHRNPQEGPAIVFANGNGDYWQDGKRLHPWKQYWLNTFLRKTVLWLMRVGVISFIFILSSCTSSRQWQCKLQSEEQVTCKSHSWNYCGAFFTNCSNNKTYSCQTNYSCESINVQQDTSI